jgi:hypothetical protein
MSVFELTCAEAASGLVCDHIRTFYKSIGGEPPVFYILEETELPPGYKIEAVRSDSGDECHRDVTGVSNGQIKKAFKDRRHWNNFFICDGSDYRPLRQEDVDAFAEQ